VTKGWEDSGALEGAGILASSCGGKGRSSSSGIIGKRDEILLSVSIGDVSGERLLIVYINDGFVLLNLLVIIGRRSDQWHVLSLTADTTPTSLLSNTGVDDLEACWPFMMQSEELSTGRKMLEM
jgi:hypothetical protein